MVSIPNEAIQAFPLTPKTYIGTPGNLSNEQDGPFRILHLLEDSTVTITFVGSNTKTFDAGAGMDFALDPSWETLTVTGQVLLS